MKRITNNPPIPNNNNVSYIINNIPSYATTNSQQTMGNTMSTASSVNNCRTVSSSYVNAQKNPNGFLPITQIPKNRSVINSTVAQQADRWFGPSIGKSSVPQNKEILPYIQPSSKTVLSTLPPSRPSAVSTVGIRSSQTARQAVESTNNFPTNYTNLNGSLLVQNFNDPEFLRFVRCVTTLIFSERYYNDSKAKAQIAAIHCYSGEDSGNHRAAFQFLASNFNDAGFSKLDMTLIISPEILNNMPDIYYPILKKLPGSKFETVEEILAALEINPALSSPLIWRNQKQLLSKTQQTYNLSGNTSPDLETDISYFEGQIPIRQKAYYDVKNNTRGFKPLNQVRVFNKHMDKITLNAHSYLERQLMGISTESQTYEIATFQAYLNNSVQRFEDTKNLKEFIHTYNHAFTAFGPWLVKNKLPMNLIAEVGFNNLIVDKDLLESYLKTYNKLSTLSSSPLKVFYAMYSRASPPPSANNSVTMLKECVKHLEEGSLPKDIL